MHVDWVADPTDDRIADAAALITGFWREVLGPDEREFPAPSLAVDIGVLPGVAEGRMAVASEGSEVLGVAVVKLDTVNNLDKVWMPYLVVRDDARRRGVGTELLAAVRDETEAVGRRMITQGAPAASEPAVAFATRVGALSGLQNEQNRMEVADIPPGLLEEWVARAAERAADYTLVSWDHHCPDEHLEAFARVIEVMNTAPHDESFDSISVTPERVRAGESQAARESEGWTTCARHDRSGELVGLTELAQSTFRRWFGIQGDTGVDPAHRDKGLGRWMKAHNALRMLHEHPDVEVVETWNAAVNEPMLNINRAMGFRCVARWTNWRLEL